MAIPQQALDLQTQVQKIVLAGMKVMYDPQTFQVLLDGIASNVPLPQKLALEVAGVLKIVDGKSPNGLPPAAVAPAAVLLLYDLAQFMQESKSGNPSPDDLQQALPLLRQALAQAIGQKGKAAQGANADQPAQQPSAPQQQAPTGLIGRQMTQGV